MKTVIVNRSVMVSILAVMLLIYGLQGTAYGQDAPDTVVEFSDVSLARIVRATLRLNVFLDDVNLLKIPKAEVAKLTILSGSGVQDLTGLEHATELKELYLRANRVSDLTPLSGLTQLRELDFWGNRIIDITPLSGLTQLRELNLSANEIRDITPLAGLTELTDAISRTGILFLEQLLTVLIPNETALLANYPNPFNPETWIPYQLSKPAEVTITIYAVDGRVVRTLALGYQPSGIYQNRSRAAYWDGRNAFGEPVASGVYFYTLTTSDFSATRKMLIQK